MFKLQKTRLQIMQFAIYILDKPVTLKQGQGHQIYKGSIDPKHGYDHVKFERSCFNGVQAKANVKDFFSNEKIYINIYRMYMCVCVYIYIYTSLSLYIYLYLSVYLSIYLSIYVYTTVKKGDILIMYMTFLTIQWSLNLIRWEQIFGQHFLTLLWPWHYGQGHWKWY